MKVQTIATMYAEHGDDGELKAVHRRGEVFDLKDATDAIEKGLVRPADAEGELPPPNAGAAVTAPTQPDGTPIPADAEGNPLTAGALTNAAPDWKAPSTHKEADAMAADLGITFPRKTTVAEKSSAIRAVLDAQAAGEPTPTSEDLTELSDEELIQRAVDYGHSEDEVIELGHDELVLFVAEAMNRQTADPAQQAERTAELADRRDDDED